MRLDRVRWLVAFVFSSTKKRYDNIRLNCRIRADRYSTGKISPGEYTESIFFLTWYLSVEGYPLVIQKSWWVHHDRLTWDYMYLHSSPTSNPLMISIMDGIYVIIQREFIPGVPTKRRGRSPSVRFNWRSYHPGFSDSNPGLVRRWYNLMRDMERREFRLKLLT